MGSVDVLFPIDEGRAIRDPCCDYGSGMRRIYETLYFQDDDNDDDAVAKRTVPPTTSVGSRPVRSSLSETVPRRSEPLLRPPRRVRLRTTSATPVSPTTPSNAPCNVPQLRSVGRKQPKPARSQHRTLGHQPAPVSPTGSNKENDHATHVPNGNKTRRAPPSLLPRWSCSSSVSLSSLPPVSARTYGTVKRRSPCPVSRPADSTADRPATSSSSSSSSPSLRANGTSAVPVEVHIVEQDNVDPVLSLCRAPDTPDEPYGSHFDAKRKQYRNARPPLNDTTVETNQEIATLVEQDLLQPSDLETSFLGVSSAPPDVLSAPKSTRRNKPRRTPLEMERLLAIQSTKMAAKNEYTLLQQLQAKQEVIDMLTEELYRSRMRIHELLSQAAVYDGDNETAEQDRTSNTDTSSFSTATSDTGGNDTADQPAPGSPYVKSRSLSSRHKRRTRHRSRGSVNVSSTQRYSRRQLQHMLAQHHKQRNAHSESYDPSVYLKSGMLFSTAFILFGGRPLLLFIIVVVWMAVDML